MTWEWVSLILGGLAFIALESYLSVLRERTAIARMTLGLADADTHHLTNGNS